jgi:DNA-binding response OmpR family regulator
VHRLRQKLETEPARPRYLQTEAGAGYRIEIGPAAPDRESPE